MIFDVAIEQSTTFLPQYLYSYKTELVAAAPMVAQLLEVSTKGFLDHQSSLWSHKFTKYKKYL